MSSEGTQDQAFILEKKEISVDDDEDFEYNSIKDSDDGEGESDDSDQDLDDFNKLKAKTTLKMLQQTGGSELEATKIKAEVKPKTLQRPIVMDDYIRNFMQQFKMYKSLNTF